MQKGVAAKKRALVSKADDLEVMIKELLEEMKTLPEHLFTKDWQNSQLTSLPESLPEDN